MATKIYVIDDDTALRTAYAATLTRLGYDVETANDGLQGQDLVKKASPDLIVLDMLMPNLDGIGFLKWLRTENKNTTTKVVVVSNFESMPEANDLDIVKYLSKIQFNPEAVAAAVDAILKGTAA